MTEDEDADTERVELEFGSKTCVCPRCGSKLPHTQRGRPCSEEICPECGAAMKGDQCQ